MAYKNIVGISCADKNEMFTRVRDFLCKRNGTYDYSVDGIGWTLHDSSYAADEDNCAVGDWFVIYSPGEGGKDDLYFQFKWISTTYLQVHGYQAWDATTHAGSTNRYVTANNWLVYNTDTPLLSVYGDLDGFAVMHTLSSTDTRLAFGGKMVPGWGGIGTDIATCSSTLTAGSDVSITVDSVPANWAVDGELFIRTTHNDAMSTVKIEKITIKTLVGNTITADLTNSYTTGNVLSQHVGYFMTNIATDGVAGNNILIDHGGVTGTGQWYLPSTPPSSYINPDQFEDTFILMDFVNAAANGFEGVLANIKKVPIFGVGFATDDILEESDGTQWRCKQCYNNDYVGFREV